MDSLNKNPIISELIMSRYSMLINKNFLGKEAPNVLNMEKLVIDFPLDITWNNGVITKTTVPGFISKSLHQIQNLNKNNKEEVNYKYPPNGPIETDFTCIYCEKNGPDYHKINCKRPFNSSLVLTKTSSRFPGAEKNTSYDLIVKKSGQKKVASKRARNEIFADNIELFYQYSDETKCIIRISKNGNINIISADYNDIDLPSIIVNKINEVPDALTEPFKIKTSYSYMITGQFNLFPLIYHDKLLINLNILNNNLWEIPLYKSQINSKNVFMIKINNKITHYIVNNYNYNSGEDRSRSGKLTNPFIIFNITSPDDLNVKYSVMIYQRGSVQMKASYINKENITSKLSLENVSYFLRTLLGNLIIYSDESNYPLISESIETIKKSKINNMIKLTSKNKPEQPQVCQNRGGSKGGNDIRPNPYSFYGICPMPGYLSIPGGVLRKDGLYEPCCKSVSKTGQFTYDYYAKLILNGFQVPKPDNLSAVYIPGTKIQEPRGFVGLKNMTKKQIIDFLDEYGYIGNSIINSFDNNSSFKTSVLTSMSQLVFTPKIKQILTESLFDKFTENVYLLTPIFDKTIPVKLYIDNLGVSYFINQNNGVSIAKIEEVKNLSNTILDGYLAENQDFYAIDVIYYKGTNISNLAYYNKEQKSRNAVLLNTVNFLKDKIQDFNIITNFDLNIVQGAKFYADDPEVNSLLFIPYSNGTMLLWNETINNDVLITLDVNHISENRYSISLENKFFPPELLLQGPSHDIQLPKVFTNKLLKNGKILLLKINLNLINNKIERVKPFTPIESRTIHINTYSQAKVILESINNPIKRTVFTEINKNPPGFKLDKLYYFTSIGEPLEVK